MRHSASRRSRRSTPALPGEPWEALALPAGVVLGHVVGVMVAHALLAGTGLGKALLIRLELPLAIAMVFYTAFGLWLLAAPSIA